MGFWRTKIGHVDRVIVLLLTASSSELIKL